MFCLITFAIFSFLFYLFHFHNLSFTLSQYEVQICCHYYIIMTFIPTFIVPSYPDENDSTGEPEEKVIFQY